MVISDEREGHVALLQRFKAHWLVQCGKDYGTTEYLNAAQREFEDDVAVVCGAWHVPALRQRTAVAADRAVGAAQRAMVDAENSSAASRSEAGTRGASDPYAFPVKIGSSSSSCSIP